MLSIPGDVRDEAVPLIEQDVVVETVHDKEGSGQEKSEDIVLFCEDLTKKKNEKLLCCTPYTPVPSTWKDPITNIPPPFLF